MEENEKVSIPVKLQVFEGPLDLLLHLIDINQIDIYDIPISLITDQYLEYIRQMEEADMEVMSEFLVMAATLLRIKSEMLLPPKQKEEGQQEDPRQELTQRLLEHKMYQYAAKELRDLQEKAGQSCCREMSIPEDLAKAQPQIDLQELVGDTTLDRLSEIFQSVMKQVDERIDPIRSGYGKIEPEEISLSDKITEIEGKLLKSQKLSFQGLLKEHPTRMNVIVTFLAVLELIKSGKICISQEALFEDIRIEAVP